MYFPSSNFTNHNDRTKPVKSTVCSIFDKGYRFGFNGKELDDEGEGMGGGISTYDYGFRIYNPNIGKFLSVDPLTKEYPMLTPYQFASNTPIMAIDLDGLESAVITYYNVMNGIWYWNARVYSDKLGKGVWEGQKNYVQLNFMNDKGNVTKIFNEANTADNPTRQEGVAAVKYYDRNSSKPMINNNTAAKKEYYKKMETAPQASDPVWERAKSTMKNYVAVWSLFAGGASLSLGGLTTTEGLITIGNMAGDVDQLTGVSDNMDPGFGKTAIKLGEAGVGLWSLKGDVSTLFTAPKVTTIYETSLGGCASVSDADDVKDVIKEPKKEH